MAELRSTSEGLEEEIAALVSDLKAARSRLLALEQGLGELMRQAQARLDEAVRIEAATMGALEEVERRIRELGETGERARSLLGDVEGLIAETSTRLESVESSWRDRLEGLLRDAASHVEIAVGEWRKAIEGISSEGRQVLSALRSEGEEEVGRLRRGLEEAMGVLRGEVEQAFMALRRDHEAAVASLEQDLRARVDGAASSLRSEVERIVDRIEVHRAEVKQAREAIDGLQAASFQRVKATEEVVRDMREALERVQVRVLAALLVSGAAAALAVWSVWVR